MEDASNTVMVSMVAPPGGSIKYVKLETLVEKYGDIMEVHNYI